MPRDKIVLPTIIIDTRERLPWDFDGDDAFAAVEHTKLDQGDYSIKGMEHIVSIERKANANELFTNLSQKDHRERIYAEMCRLAGIVKYRFMVIEQNLEDVLSPHSYAVNTMNRNKNSQFMPPALIMQHLMTFMIDYNVHVIFAGSKGKNIAKRLLLQIYELHRKGKLPC